MADWVGLAYALAGTLLASLLACVPALHVYNVAGLLIWLWVRSEGASVLSVPPQGVAMLLLGMAVGYAVCNTIPSLFLGVPDESAAWIVLPGQRYVMEGRGFEGAVLCGIGSLGAIVALLVLAPFVGSILVPVRQVLQPHLHWVLAAIVGYILLSEWPKGEGRGATAWARLWDGWRSLLAGLATFGLAGLLGVILAYRPLVSAHSALHGLMPAFVGLYGVPWVLQGMLLQTRVPRQEICRSVEVTPVAVAQGIGTGVLGGLLAAFLPLVSGGIGGLMAGHAAAQRDDRVFLVSQGASKTVYYVGALLFFFAPGLHLRRGGMAWMLNTLYTPYTPGEYWRAVAATAVCGAAAFGALLILGRGAAGLVGRVNGRWLFGATLVVLAAVVIGLTGWQGALIALVATGIGLIPIASGARRLNGVGVLLVPALLSMAGLGPRVAGWLGLI